ncbi:hypothetical protein VTO42DRAFT_1963 [Malbranchea cinnamomea]
MATDSSIPKLTSTAQYERWFAGIRDQAIADDIWELIDPNTTEDLQQKELERPRAPTPFEARYAIWQRRYELYERALKLHRDYAALEGDVTVQGGPYQHPGQPPAQPDPDLPVWEEDLDEVETQRLHAMEKAYATAYERYEKQLERLAALRTVVFSTVDEGWIENLRRDNAPLRQILAHLRDRLQPDEDDRMQILARFRDRLQPDEYDRMAAIQRRRDQLKRVPKQDPLKWISRWRMLYDDMVKMGEFNPNSLIMDFLSINREIDGKFTAYVKVETRRRAVLGQKQLTFHQIALMFEEEYREKALDKPQKGRNGTLCLRRH